MILNFTLLLRYYFTLKIIFYIPLNEKTFVLGSFVSRSTLLEKKPLACLVSNVKNSQNLSTCKLQESMSKLIECELINRIFNNVLRVGYIFEFKINQEIYIRLIGFVSEEKISLRILSNFFS